MRTLVALLLFGNFFVATVTYADSCDFGPGDLNDNIVELEDLKIKIILPHKKYAKLMFRALTSVDHSNRIDPAVKKNIKGDIEFSVNGKSCIDKGKIRITGDYLDHLNRTNITSSLKIQLKSKSIGNITRFKLLLPETRNAFHEILFTGLVRKLGVMAPRTRFVQVQIGNVTQMMIFQEDLSKELLEFHDEREDFIFVGSELLSLELGFPAHLFSVDNKAYVFKNNRVLEAAAVLQKLNSSKNPSSYSRPFLDSALPGVKNFLRYYLFLAMVEGYHATALSNSIIYYDSIRREVKPIYYDGNIRVFNFGKTNQISKKELNKILKESSLVDWDLVLDILRSIEERSLLVPEFELVRTTSVRLAEQIGGEDFVVKWIRQVEENIKALIVEKNKNQTELYSSGQEAPLYNAESFKKYIDSLRAENVTVRFFDVPNDINESLGWNCEAPVADPLCDYLVGGIRPDSLKYSGRWDQRPRRTYDPVVVKVLNPDQILFPDEAVAIQIDELNKIELINWDENLNSISQSGGSIHVKCQTRCQLLIKDGDLKNLEIRLTYSGNDFDHEDHSNQKTINKRRSLTGALTIVDSSLTNFRASVINSPWEDAVNCIRCSGTIDRIFVRSALADGLDLDFSNLHIKEIDVSDAGNDCADFSKGDYRVDYFRANQCGDKGLSLGEQSVASVKKAQLRKSAIGIAVKDSSVLFVPDGKYAIDFVEVSSHILTYNKKQEYGTGRVSYKSP